MINCDIKLLTATAQIPTYGDPYAVGADLYADNAEVIVIAPKARAVVSTGISIAPSEFGYCRIAPRSGLAVKKGIDVLAGVVDVSYRGEVLVCLVNHSDSSFEVSRGDRIAQLIFEKADQLKFTEVETLNTTARGSAGFGSTGR